MGFKVLGTLLLLAAGGYLSMTVNRFERCRLRVLDGYIALLGYIRGQIDCYAMPLTDILAHADPDLILMCLGGCRTCEIPPNDVLPALIAESRPYLEPESARLLTAFTGELGTAHRTEQVARLGHYIEALTRERSKLADALPARLRTGSTLCLCCTLAAVVLLW